MHREITYADRAFGEQESRLSLYLLTALIGLVLLADLWPIAAAWIEARGLALPSWPNQYGGYRLALVAALLGGARILFGSIDALLQGRVGADLALAIACVAAILVNEPLVAAELVFVGLLGECLENITFERAQRSVRQLAELTPKRCWRIRDGQEERILVSELQVGDQVVVKPGGKIPADGVVLSGSSAVDTSVLTGESLPLDKGPGDEVLAGSLNGHGALTLEARRIQEHTVLGRVVEMTARALQDRSHGERTADRLARYFLPAVLLLAVGTFVVAFALHAWGSGRGSDALRPGLGISVRYALYPALSVLVVACPCALILATPAAVIAALGRLAGTGVLLKGGSVLERLATIEVFAFDKTGTLTEGRLELGDIVPVEGVSADELLRLAASVEQQSEHPLAGVLCQAARQRGLTLESVEDFTAYPGSGVSGKIGGVPFLIGNRRHCEQQGVSLPPEVQSHLERLDGAGQTVLLVCRAGQFLGALGARDRVRQEARGVLDSLRTLGIRRLVMLTGDRPAVAREVAGQLGIEEWHAELLPQQKAELVSGWQEATPPSRVAMVGDGINDAPALARATVGLAIGGTSNDVASEAGDVVLLIGPGQGQAEAGRNPLRHLPLLLRLSREAVRIIRQNILVFAFGVNAVGIALTAWLWPLVMPTSWHETGPVVAVVYHQFGSLLVLLNSMRLLWFDRASTSPLALRWNARFQWANSWLERRLDIDETLHVLLHHWQRALSVIVFILVVGWAASGLYAIGTDEVGIVCRFGRAMPEDLDPGLHWRWPWPLERVVRVQPHRVRTVEIGFRIVPGSGILPGGRPWSSAHGGGGLLRDPDEAVMITGDNNLLEVQGSVRYTLDDPRVFLFDVATPEKTLRHAAESVLREVVAGRPMSELLTADRSAFGSEVRDRLAERCAALGPGGLGLKIEGVSLHDLHPPQEVVQAYHDVTRAMERRDREVNLATTDRTRRVAEQEARGLEAVRQAEAERYEKIHLALARQLEFLARQRARSALSWAQVWPLLVEIADELGRGRPASEVGREYRERRRALVAEQSALTDFRLYWDSVTQMLGGRAKVLVDVEKLPARRSLWLMPFEPAGPPALPRRANGRATPQAAGPSGEDS